MRYDVIVIGVGTMGAATCYHLAKRGARVLGLEQFDVAHDRGSHAGQSRLIRKAYFEHPDYVPLLQRAFQLWAEIEKEAETQLYFKTGILYGGSEKGGVISGLKKSAELHGIPLEDQSISYGDKWPQFRFPEDQKVFFEPDAGFLLPEKSIRTMTGLAVKHGAEIQTGHKIIDWKANGEGISVRTTRQTYHSKKLVITAGAYVQHLLSGYNYPRLRVTQQLLAWFEMGDPKRYFMSGFPCWGIEVDGGLLYGFPYDDGYAEDGPTGLKVAFHRPGKEIAPEKTLDFDQENEEKTLRSYINQFFQDAPGEVVDFKSCLYTYSPDDHFILDCLPGFQDRVVIGTGFSGHGFKFAPVIGEILSDLATAGKTDLPAGFLKLDRF